MTELADMIKMESIAWWRLTLQDAFDLHLKLSSRVRELEEDLKLRAKSYEANSKGWQKDIAAAKERIKVLEAERDRLKSCLYGLLEALQAKHIDELIAKSPEHLIKFGEVVKDSYQEKAAEVIDLRARHAALVTTTRAIAGSGIELDDNRIPYVVMQIDRSVLEELKAALAEVK